MNTSVGNQQSSPVIVYCSTRTLTDEVTAFFPSLVYIRFFAFYFCIEVLLRQFSFFWFTVTCSKQSFPLSTTKITFHSQQIIEKKSKRIYLLQAYNLWRAKSPSFSITWKKLTKKLAHTKMKWLRKWSRSQMRPSSNLMTVINTNQAST